MSFGMRGRKQRVSSPSIFISKTFEILEVVQFLFRITSTNRSSAGTPMGSPSSSTTWRSLSRRFSLFSSAIAIFHPLSASSICTTSTKYAMRPIRIFSSTSSSATTASKGISYPGTRSKISSAKAAMEKNPRTKTTALRRKTTPSPNPSSRTRLQSTARPAWMEAKASSLGDRPLQTLTAKIYIMFRDLIVALQSLILPIARS